MVLYILKIGKGHKMEGVEFAKRHGAIKLDFSELPTTHQLAIVRYMAVDGEAWEHPSGFEKAKSINNFIRKNISYWVKKYGVVKFWSVEIPTEVILPLVFESIRKDNEGFESFEDYHKWYISFSSDCHGETNRWPCILGSDDEEVFQDGWHRFHCYVGQRAKKIPCIAYA